VPGKAPKNDRLIEKSQIPIARNVGITVFAFLEIYLFQKMMTFSEASQAQLRKMGKLIDNLT
jgi:hypothetical protein